jgi:5'-methylthioadenosine phosphorylase
MWAIIGGSGFEKFEGFKVLERLEIDTPFGNTSSGLCKAELNGHQFLFLSRHGLDHEILPSQINHKANIYALKKYGAKAILSFSAVGSLREELAPGDLVVPSQYIDRTKKGLKETTYFGDMVLGNLVGHMSMGEPINMDIFPILKNIIKKASSLDHQAQDKNQNLESKKYKSHFDKTYICMEGPNFSTRAESKMYQVWGADIIGMTNFPEYALAKEANILYVPMCFVTDYDSWRHEEKPVTLEQVISVMRHNNSKAFSLVLPILQSQDLKNVFTNYKSGFPVGIMSGLTKMSEKSKEILKVLS